MRYIINILFACIFSLASGQINGNTSVSVIPSIRPTTAGGGKSVNMLWYGFTFDKTSTSPAVTRISENDNVSVHRVLPIQSRMAGCLLNDDGTVNYYLNPDDWTKQVNGSASDLTGTDGQVMIEVPEFYYQVTEDENDVTIKFCLFQRSGYTKVESYYVSAYKATVNRLTSKLSSVKNNTATYRGGNNNAVWDAEDYTLLGKPATVISQANYRTYARNRGENWNSSPFWQRQWLYWLFVCEYATRNTQAAYNIELDDSGYHQGGLGAGPTTLVKDDWNSYNSYFPFLPIGITDQFGNTSGQVDYDVPGFPNSSGDSVLVNRYRGLDCWFGQIWDVVDGINTFIQTDTSGANSILYLATDPQYFAYGTSTNYDSITVLPRAQGIIKYPFIGTSALMIPILTGGTYTQFYSDTYFTDTPDADAWRVTLMGGYGHIGANAGFVCWNNVYDNPTLAQAGTRLYYIP